MYKKFGKADHLTIVYSDKNLGMQGLLTMEKWVIRIIIIIVFLWISLYGYSYYSSWMGSTGTGHTNSNSGSTKDINNNDDLLFGD